MPLYMYVSLIYWFCLMHTPIIKYIFEIYLSIICIAVGKNGKENMEGLKTVQLRFTMDYYNTQ